jgi:hypothetical protein
MRNFILTILLFSVILIAFGQDKSENAFIKAINEGYTTGPDFVVLTIRNLNNKETKELITDVASVYYAFGKEFDANESSKIREYLLNNSKTRIFELSNKEALERLNFENYQLKYLETIEEIIIQNNIVDSLSKIQLYRDNILEKFYTYSIQRKNIAKEIKDSIEIKRKLSIEEKVMLKNLEDQYYDWHYNEYATISKEEKDLMKNWNSKIKLAKDEYQKYETEIIRLENKFFRDYYKKFGLNFLHVAFKYGVIFGANCENGMIEFTRIVK